MQGGSQETCGASSDLSATGSTRLSFEGPFSGLKKSSKTIAPQWASPVAWKKMGLVAFFTTRTSLFFFFRFLQV